MSEQRSDRGDASQVYVVGIGATIAVIAAIFLMWGATAWN